MAAGAILVERRADGAYRAYCTLFPDCEAVAATEADARRRVEAAIERIVRERHEPANPVDALFQRLRAAGRKAFMPFVSAGDPDLDTTLALVDILRKHSADLLEIGFPYSDPIADGPVMQASYTRALTKGLRIDQIFERLSNRPPADGPPLVGMTSYALIHRRGPERFLAEAARAGLSGLIVPDLPVEEARDLAGLAAARDFKLIQLVTPTTPRQRAVEIARTSTGFLYYVSVTGITGERDRLPSELTEQLRWLRGQTDLPICVGFGISRPEHVRMLRDVVDGVIVASALVRKLEQVGTKPLPDILKDIADLADALAAALNPS